MTLREACAEVMADPAVIARYPDGLDGNDVMTEIRRKHGQDAFALCSVIDVVDEMRALFGAGRS